jgi:hypothetical protein
MGVTCGPVCTTQCAALQCGVELQAQVWKGPEKKTSAAPFLSTSDFFISSVGLSIHHPSLFLFFFSPLVLLLILVKE